jgi:hypothetical protein
MFERMRSKAITLPSQNFVHLFEGGEQALKRELESGYTRFFGDDDEEDNDNIITPPPASSSRQTRHIET